MVLIKSVAAVIPSYAMSSFMLPASVCSNLDRTFKNFVWGFPPSKARNLSLKSWDSICLPKVVGGLGLRRAKEVNLALIAKLGWKLHSSSDCLWVSQLRGKYLQTGSFLSLSAHPPPHQSSASWLWKDILKSQSLIAQDASHIIFFSIWTAP